MKAHRLLLLTSVLSTQSFAGVNLKDASYHMEIPLKEAPGLALRYSSRALSEGLFGRGWCSALDLKIERKSDLSLTLSNCDEKTSYEPRRITRWMASDSEIFESTLTRGSNLSDQIEATQTEYIRRRGDETWVFGKDGRLLSVDAKGLTATRSKNKNSDFFLIERQEGQTKLEIEKSLVRRMKANSDQGLRLLYKEKRLSEISGSTGATMRFEYDGTGNMTRGVNTRGQSFRMKYDRGLDQVLAVESGNCVETFEYLQNREKTTRGLQSRPLGRFETESLAFESCNNEPRRLKTRMRFVYDTTKAGQVILHSSTTETNTERIQIVFDATTGAPQKLERLPTRPLRVGENLDQTLGGSNE